MMGRAILTKKRLWLWPAVLSLFLFLVLPVLQLGFVLLGRALSPVTPGSFSYSVWPSNGEVVGSLTPTLRWPSVSAARYEVTVHTEQDGRLVQVLTANTGEPRFTIPAELLQEDQAYLWRVAAAEDDGPKGLYSGKFSTLTSLSDGGMTVAPAVYSINVDNMLSGVELHVESAGDHLVEIELPPILTAGGKRKIAARGSFSLVVTPSVEFFRSGEPGISDDGSLAVILLRQGENRVEEPDTIDVSTMGALRRNVDSGFDPVLDTPSFANFATGVLAKVTKGTCLGMVLAARISFGQFNDCRLARGDCVRLRTESLLEPEKTREWMNFLHLANLDPQNWSLAVTSVIGSDSQFEIWAEVLSQLRGGKPVPVATLSPRSPTPADSRESLGHAVLVHAAQEFDDLYIFHVYDPDHLYVPGGTMGAFLVVERSGDAPGRVLYAAGGAAERVEVFTLPAPHLLGLLAPVVSESYSSIDMKLSGTLGAW